MATLPAMLEHDRARSRPGVGGPVGQAAWRLGVSISEYRELEAGTRWPSSETWHRICKPYGWPQTFADRDRRVAGNGWLLRLS